MRKMIIVLLSYFALSMTLLMNTSISTIGHASPAPVNSTGVSLCSTYTQSTKTSLSIVSGQATATASLTGYPNTTTKVNIYIYLQRFQNGVWSNVNSAFQSFTGYRGTLQQKFSVTKGYSYRVYASYYAYSGSACENMTGYSSVVTY